MSKMRSMRDPSSLSGNHLDDVINGGLHMPELHEDQQQQQQHQHGHHHGKANSVSLQTPQRKHTKDGQAVPRKASNV